MYLVTHTDLDGVGCEIVARYYYPELTADRVYHCEYTNVDDTVRRLLETSEDHLLISDISVNETTAQLIAEKYRDRVDLYDHHRTAEVYLKDYDWAIVDLARSATQLLFDTLRQAKPTHDIPINLPAFVLHVNDYDLWHHTLRRSTQFNDLLSLLGKRRFVKVIMDRLDKNKALISYHDELFLDAMTEKKLRYFRERAEKAVVIDNRLVIVANRHLSDLSEYVRTLENPPESWKNVQYIDMINLDRGSHSLRSYDLDFDVSKVAAANGGGGHPKAAGYQAKPLDEEVLRQL